MHELSIAQNIVDLVEQEMAAHNVEKLLAVNIAVGKLAAVAHEQLAFCYTMLIVETNMAGSKLNIRDVPLGYRCDACKGEFTSDEMVFTCKLCGADAPGLVSGRDLVVESIEV